MNIFFTAPFILVFNFVLLTIVSNQLDIFYNFSGLYYLYLAIALSIFTFCYLITRNIFIPELHKIKLKLPLDLKRKYFSYSIFAGMFLIILDHILISGPAFFTSSAITEYRFYLTELGGSSKVPFLSLFNFFFFSAGPFIFTYNETLTKKEKFLYVFAIVFYVFLSSARSSLFFFLLLMFFYCFGYKKITFKTLLIMILVMIIAILGFSVIGELVGKSTKGNGDIIFFIYWVGGAHALDIILNNIDRMDYSLISFHPFHGLLSSMGVIKDNSQIILPYFFTPLPTNVYSIFGVYVLDYGIAGSFFFISIFGFISGVIEKFLARHPDSSYLRLMYALNCTILVLGVFHDYYTSSGITYTILMLGLLFFR